MQLNLMWTDELWSYLEDYSNLMDEMGWVLNDKVCSIFQDVGINKQSVKLIFFEDSNAKPVVLFCVIEYQLCSNIKGNLLPDNEVSIPTPLIRIKGYIQAVKRT